MKKPKRSDDKYWTGTRNFNDIQYETDLEDYIIELESQQVQLDMPVIGDSVLDDNILKALIEYNEYLFTFIDRDNVGIGTEKKDIIKWYNEHYRNII